jgi:hypothetical protein
LPIHRLATVATNAEIVFPAFLRGFPPCFDVLASSARAAVFVRWNIDEGQSWSGTQVISDASEYNKITLITVAAQSGAL